MCQGVALSTIVATITPVSCRYIGYMSLRVVTFTLILMSVTFRYIALHSVTFTLIVMSVTFRYISLHRLHFVTPVTCGYTSYMLLHRLHVVTWRLRPFLRLCPSRRLRRLHSVTFRYITLLFVLVTSVTDHFVSYMKFKSNFTWLFW